MTAHGRLKEIRQALLRIAKDNNIIFDLILLRYTQERFLYRLSISRFNEGFVLKGGLLLYSLSKFEARPTRDIDFLAQQISNDIETIKTVFIEICSIKLDDEVVFDIDSIVVESIIEEDKYSGVRVRVIGYLGESRQTLKIDIGFSDIVVPKASYIEYPVLLDMESPNIKTYSIESVIAEKFEAAVSLSLANSRMKDFYDINDLLGKYSFDGAILRDAVFQTFQKRGTIIEKDNIIFSDNFVGDQWINKLWTSFQNKIGNNSITFDTVMKNIKAFLEPIYNSILKENDFFGRWDNTEKKWNKLS